MLFGTEPFFRGRHLSVEFLRLPEGAEPAREFLESFASGSKHHRSARRIEAAIEILANTPPGGRALSRERFKAVEGTKILEFKAHQLRLYCFYAPGGRLILAAGSVKKQDRHRKENVKRVQEWRDRFHGQIWGTDGRPRGERPSPPSTRRTPRTWRETATDAADERPDLA